MYMYLYIYKIPVLHWNLPFGWLDFFRFSLMCGNMKYAQLHTFQILS